jgi:hypothetical protein
MVIWQADLHRPPLKNEQGEPLWEFLVCDADFDFSYGATAPQATVNGAWITDQLKIAIQRAEQTPDKIQVFRPQALSLLQVGSDPLGITVEPSRQTVALQRWLLQRSQWYPSLETHTGAGYDPLHLDQPPPQPLPESLWGEQWRFAAMQAGDFEQTFPYQPIPIRQLPPERMPLHLGLPSTSPLPGIVIDAGRQTMPLCRWLQTAQPAWLNHIPGDPDGLILEAGLVDRWVMTTFSDPEVTEAGRLFEQRKRQCAGLHFLLVRPDDSGMTNTGLWLLQQPL